MKAQRKSLANRRKTKGKRYEIKGRIIKAHEIRFLRRLAPDFLSNIVNYLSLFWQQKPSPIPKIPKRRHFKVLWESKTFGCPPLSLLHVRSLDVDILKIILGNVGSFTQLTTSVSGSCTMSYVCGGEMNVVVKNVTGYRLMSFLYSRMCTVIITGSWFIKK